MQKKTKISLPAKYFMTFPDKHADVLYNIVSLKIHTGNDMDKGNYVCDLLD